MYRSSRIWIPAIAFAAAAISGTIAYILYDAPDEFSVRLRIKEQVAQRIAAEAASLEGISYQFIANQDLNDSLYAYGKRTNRYDVALYNVSFMRQLESQNLASSLLEEAFFLDYDDADRIPLTMTEDFLRPEIAEIRRFIWERSIEADGACIWMDGTLLVHGERYLIAARLIKRLNSGEPIGVLALLVASRRVAELLDAATEAGDESANEFNILVSATGEVLAATEESFVGGQISSAIGPSSYFETILAQGQRSGRFYAAPAGRRAAAVFTRIGSDGPALITVYSNRNYPGQYRRAFAAAFFALSAAVAAGLVLRKPRSIGIPGSSDGGAFDDMLRGLPPLSVRERQLLSHLARGLSNKEIADELGIKEQTVKNYLKPLYEKLGVHDRVSALLKLRAFHSPGSSDEST